MAKIDLPNATTGQLLQLANYHAGAALKRCEFYRTKSAATYRVQAGDNAQEWAELYARLAEKLEALQLAEQAGLIPLADG
jgi:hypothetical protein